MPLTKLREYHLPQNKAEVIRLLHENQDDALIVAGGTFISGLIARGLVTETEVVIDIQKLGLNQIQFDSNGLELGATVKFRQLEWEPKVQSDPAYGAIKDALTYPPAQIINTATVGGCVASSCVFFDLPVSLLALRGVVTSEGPSGSRFIPLNEFFPGLFDNALEENEFVSAVTLPVPVGRTVSAFIKMEVNANDLAILNVAVCFSVDALGVCEDVQVWLGGGVGESYERATAAEASLKGSTLSEDAALQAGEAAQNEITPLNDHRASEVYRKAMIKVLVKRTILKAIDRLD
ncbi:MAG: FAD binding domain-containing protein [Pseudomonadales bacterium]